MINFHFDFSEMFCYNNLLVKLLISNTLAQFPNELTLIFHELFIVKITIKIINFIFLNKF